MNEQTVSGLNHASESSNIYKKGVEYPQLLNEVEGLLNNKK